MHQGATLDIIIVNWNGGGLIRQCLQSIVEAETPFQVHVVVVDNASRDGSQEMIRQTFPQVTLLESRENLGFGRGNNLARPHASAPFVLFLNPDTVVPKGTLEGMVQHMEAHPDIGALGCKMTDADGTVHGLGLQWFPTPWTEFLQTAVLNGPLRRIVSGLLPTADATKNGFVRKLYGGCYLARRDVLDAVGWFDERYFMYAEDVDMCRKIAEYGRKLFYLSDVSICHVSGGTTCEAPPGFSTLMKCESISKLIEKHQGPKGRVSYRAALFAGCLIRIVPLGVMRMLTLGLAAKKRESVRRSFQKCLLILAWSMGGRSPKIPS